MNQEEMANELARILRLMCDTDPSTEKYEHLLNRYSKLMATFHEELESCNSDLENSSKLKLDEMTLKAKELEMQLKTAEAKENSKRAKREAWFGLIKIGLLILGMLAGIIITGSLEQSTILSQKCLSFVRMLMPKVV